MPIWLVNDPEGPVLIVLAEAKVPEPGLNAGEAVGIERLRLLRELLQPLVFLRRRRGLIRLRALGGLAEKRGKEWWWGLNSQMRKREGFGEKGVEKWEFL